MIGGMSLWVRWWVLFPGALALGLALMFVMGYAVWSPWPQLLAPVGLLFVSSRIVPEIMWDGDPIPPLRRHRGTAPTGHR
jgi:hypothetical protein